MEKEKILAMVEKEMGAILPVIKNLSDIDLDFLKNHFAEKKHAYEGENLDLKYKALIALAVGIALDSPACILNNVKAAKKNGASKEEIMETFRVAKFSKSATTISSSSNALEWLNKNIE